MLNQWLTNTSMRPRDFQNAAFLLRVGLGLVFVIGGWSKLSLLLGASTHDAMVANYLSTTGYINANFQDYLFEGVLGEILTPSGFLISLSAFELLSGIALLVGFFVRPLALFYGFLLWSFVIALPTLTVPGVSIDANTYAAPAILVQIRDITLSGMMFVLYGLGAGSKSLDNRFIPSSTKANWDALGLLLRVVLALTLLVAGFLGGFPSVTTFALPRWMLAMLGLLVLFAPGNWSRSAGLAVALAMLWYFANKWSLDKSLIVNLNGIKREFALMAAGLVLFLYGGGFRYCLPDLAVRGKHYLSAYLRRPA